ncbi:MAG: protein-L-isoaspartate(D-aspartate) O-methyltransferase [Acidobacteriota bacterium]
MSDSFGDVFSNQRNKMVTGQLVSRGVSDERVLAAMGKVEREKFVPVSEAVRSYNDGPLPIGRGQTISQPYIVAYMTELLELSENEKILEVGTGSGYQTAVLAEIVEEVFSVELIPELAEKARELLIGELGYTNIRLKTGNGAAGWSEHAPYSRIIVTAAPESFPESLLGQLDEGGIIIAPVGSYFQNIIKYEKKDGEIIETVLIAVSFVPLIV